MPTTHPATRRGLGFDPVGSDRRPARWSLVFGSALALAVGNGPVILYAFSVFLKPLSQDLAIDRATASLAPAIGLVLYSAVVAVAGGLFDRVGLRRIVLSSIVLTAALFVCLGLFVQGPLTLLAFYAAITVAATGYCPVPFAKVVAASFERSRGLALGLAMAGVGVGTAVVPVVCQLLVSQAGWRIAYCALGLLIVAIAFPAAFVTLPDRAIAPATKSGDLPGLSRRQALRDRVFWQAGAAFFILAVATAGVFAHVVALLTDRGIAPLVAASAIGVGGIALILGRIISGLLVDRFHAGIVTSLFFASAAAGAALLALSLQPWTAWVGIGMVGLALGAEVDLIAYVVSRYFGLREFGAIYGYLFAIFTSGTAVGPVFMGVFYARSHDYRLALEWLAAALIGGLFLASRLGSYRYTTPHPAAGDATRPNERAA